MPAPRRLPFLAIPCLILTLVAVAAANPPEPPPARDPFESAIPNDALRSKDDVPIVFVTRAANPAEWNKLATFWNVATEEATAADPATGQPRTVVRKVVKIKVPLGLNTAPPVPAENPMTVAKWELGKRLYYDKLLSTNGTVSCATCHDPAKGFTDQRRLSLGINNSLGGVNAPTVINSGYHRFQFWDGRAATLEEQAQGPVGNALEMFAGKDDPWDEAVARLRANPEYVKAFVAVFGHQPTRDAAAKAIATYERTVLSGNSLFDRADVIMRERVKEEETGKFDFIAADFTAALKQAFEKKDAHAIRSLGLDPEADAGKAEETGQRLLSGRTLFFGKARCSNCHVGENFTDLAFHNLGVGAKDGQLPTAEWGRYTRLPAGHKDPGQVGAFKTPGLRALAHTAPYLHDGSEKTLEAVVDFYDRGGNVNEFLDPKMRDLDAEAAYLAAKARGQTPAGPKPEVFTRSGRPIIPFKLNLTPQEKADLVLFLKALEGDPIDPVVAEPARFVGGSGPKLQGN